MRGHVSYPTDGTTATKLGLGSSLGSGVKTCQMLWCQEQGCSIDHDDVENGVNWPGMGHADGLEIEGYEWRQGMELICVGYGCDTFIFFFSLLFSLLSFTFFVFSLSIMYILCKCYSIYGIPVIVYYVVYVTWKPAIKILYYILYYGYVAYEMVCAPSQYKNVFSRYGNSHYKDKTVVRPSYLYNGTHCTVKTTSSYWNDPRFFSAQFSIWRN